jgi:hypothetical protein
LGEHVRVQLRELQLRSEDERRYGADPSVIA